MHPQTVVVLLSCMLFTTLIQYHFYTPEAIANASRSSNDGYWSPSDGDFDWCEYNYQFSPYIAELFNSATSLLYIVCSLITAHAINEHIPSYIYTADIYFLSLIIICIGIGSTLFHTTLRYQV